MAARAVVALVDGIATQALRSGTGMSPKDQRALIDRWIERWLAPAPTKKKR